MSVSPKSSLSYTAVVADDHAILRKSIVDILENDGRFETPIEATDGLEAIALVRRHRPNLLTLDIAMPYAQGVEVFMEVRRWSPDTKTIVFSGLTSHTVLNELVELGVDGLFMKNGNPDLLVQAIPAVMAGKRVISPDILELLKDAPGENLTKRERQILGLVVSGNSNRNIAEILGISIKTVDHHRTSLMRKLGVHSTAELLAYALREGYLDHSRET
jgi:DNA-binding NarL/FixJ family response regulator